MSVSGTRSCGRSISAQNRPFSSRFIDQDMSPGQILPNTATATATAATTTTTATTAAAAAIAFVVVVIVVVVMVVLLLLLLQHYYYPLFADLWFRSFQVERIFVDPHEQSNCTGNGEPHPAGKLERHQPRTHGQIRRVRLRRIPVGTVVQRKTVQER